MVYLNLSDFTNAYKEKDPLCDVVYSIVSLIKEQNYKLALESLKKNHISFYNLVSRTQRLKDKQLVKFADYVINHSLK